MLLLTGGVKFIQHCFKSFLSSIRKDTRLPKRSPYARFPSINSRCLVVVHSSPTKLRLRRGAKCCDIHIAGPQRLT